MPVDAEAVATDVSPGVLVKVEGVEGAAEARLKVPENSVDLAKLLKIVGVLATGDDGLGCNLPQ